jgi:hypothetical protein
MMLPGPELGSLSKIKFPSVHGGDPQKNIEDGSELHLSEGF